MIVISTQMAMSLALLAWSCGFFTTICIFVFCFIKGMYGFMPMAGFTLIVFIIMGLFILSIPCTGFQMIQFGAANIPQEVCAKLV